MCQSDEEFVAEKRDQGASDTEIAELLRNFGYEDTEIAFLGVNLATEDGTPATSLGAIENYPTVEQETVSPTA